MSVFAPRDPTSLAQPNKLLSKLWLASVILDKYTISKIKIVLAIKILTPLRYFPYTRIQLPGA